ncbi:MAG: cation diffusion facilitator family transporter [Candidatus Taylorbacteria bacterium]|nr:cation diffusion facilitator family transporter [Candidatus Taylorbacteria bacterium]
MGSGYSTDKDRFLAVLKINIFVFIAELAAGIYSQSLSMTSDGFHVFLHVIVALVALASVYKFLGFPPEKIKRWSAGINIALFFPLAAMISYEANQRLNDPPAVNITSVFFLVAILGLIANIYTIKILHRKPDEEHSENKNRLIFYVHMIVDAIGSVIVIIGAVAIYNSGNYLLDPKLSFVLAGLIVVGAIWMSLEFISGDDH